MFRLLVAPVALAAIVSIAGCASVHQTRDESYRREDGGMLKYWKPAADAAAEHLPFAWAAVSAYLHEADGKDITITEACPEPHAYLRKDWELWEELPRVGRKSAPNNDLEKKLQDAHLRVNVWSNANTKTVIVAFGGTASLKDMGANARWFLPFGAPDAYVALTEVYMPAFITAYKTRANRSDGAWLNTARVVSTGHSLGGGLAQRFVYSLNPAVGIPSVKDVYAFNPSPVSGKRGAPFPMQAEGLTIYRIYNRGEILAGIRSILQWGNPGNSRNEGQTWVDIRYSSDWSWRALLPDGWMRAHGIRELACFMKNYPEGDGIVRNAKSE